MSNPTNPIPTATSKQTKAADALTDAVREQADAVREQTEQTTKGAQKVFDTYVEASVSSFKRSQELAEKSYKAWTESWRGAAGSPGLGLPTPDLREVVSVGFDFAQGVLDAQRQIANQLVEAFAPARS
jgi:hypothetical protein